jgi:hypothetical protein
MSSDSMMLNQPQVVDHAATAMYASVVIAVLTLIYLVRIKQSSSKLPPLKTIGLFQTINEIVGPKSPFFVYNCMKELGPVFRLAMPQMDPWIFICDPSLARRVLEEHDEKARVYKNFHTISRGPSVFTKMTHGEGWDW